MVDYYLVVTEEVKTMERPKRLNLEKLLLGGARIKVIKTMDGQYGMHGETKWDEYPHWEFYDAWIITTQAYGTVSWGPFKKNQYSTEEHTGVGEVSVIEKGLVSYAVRGKVKWFQATGPKRLLDYIREQEEDVKNILPELHARHKASKIEGQVRLFKGVKGVKSIFLDIARTGKDNYVYGSEGQFSERIPEFATQFERLKKENKIHTKMILRKGRKEINSKTSEYRFLKDVAESPAVTNIYGDKIALIIWTDEPEGIIIENSAAAKAYKSYFDIMWAQAKQ